MQARRSLLTDAQLRAEVERCLYCETKPCRGGCPVHCSPADFLMAVRGGAPEDFRRAAALVMGANPLGGICGMVCPDTHCVAACSRAALDAPIDIPACQSTIVARARELGVMPEFPSPVPPSGRRVAVVGGGPAGLGAAGALAQRGHIVTVFEPEREGGMAVSIPDFRLTREMLAADVAFTHSLGDVRTVTERVDDPWRLLEEGFDAVVVATGRGLPLSLGVPGEDAAVVGLELLADPERFDLTDRHVAVVGGGAVAADCALVARRLGAATVELIALEALSELPLTDAERRALAIAGVEISGRARVTAVTVEGGRVAGLATVRVSLPEGTPFHPSAVVDVPGSEALRPDLDAVVVAIGATPAGRVQAGARVVVAGDSVNGPSSVVEAVAAGTNAAAVVEAVLAGRPAPVPERATRSAAVLPGRCLEPVALECDFFGRTLRSPLLLSAAPPTDGLEQMRAAYRAGWAGGVLKTAFDGVTIHIPAEYMVTFSRDTYGNCDNVSGHPLDRVCREVETLRREFPDRLTLASTGGPVTGDDGGDAIVWQGNTRRLESAGVDGIEYSLSCPQGGDGTRGDIVSQDPELTATVIEWVLAAGDPDVPKLFKLTGAVTAIQPVVAAVRDVLARHPAAKAGITLANTFPTLAFRPRPEARWDEGVVVGMSGAGVFPITALAIAKAAPFGVPISANGGVMSGRDAADLLALGAATVQVCTVVLRWGYGIVDDLHSGLSHLLEARGLHSVAELIGRALPDPITAFEALSPVKAVSDVDRTLCLHCGSCTRCPYLAITLDDEVVPHTDAAHCIGCSLCVQRCPSGALSMRSRTPGEAARLEEA